jgi:hypothetical protein
MSTIDFATLEDLIRMASEDHGATSKNATHGHYQEHRWTYGVDFPGAVRLARRGWPDGTTLVAALARDLEVPHLTAHVSYQLSDDAAGAVGYDLGAVVAGDPDHWIVPAEAPTSRDITVTVNPEAAAVVSSDEMCRRGAATLAIVDALARAGHRVTVTLRAESLGDDEHTRAVYTCPIVRPGEFLDIDRLAFTIAHPAMSRRLLFGVMDADPDWHKLGARRSGRYGSPSDATAPPVDLHMPGLRSTDTTFRSLESTRAWAIAQVARIVKGDER